VDETNAAIGLARVYMQHEADAMLARIQQDLFDLGADLATPAESRKNAGALRIGDTQVTRLEQEIDAMNATLAPLKSFVLPGGGPACAHLHLARAICRRAERRLTALSREETINPAALRYLNRLSDHLFVLSRTVSEGGETLWQPGANR
jgi:cob(I)alamin adenosyltransferase